MRFDMCAEIGERAVVVGEGTVQLGLEAGVEPDLELRRGHVAERDQVAAMDWISNWTTPLWMVVLPFSAEVMAT